MSTSMGAQTGDNLIFGATWESWWFSWAEWHRLAFAVDILTHMNELNMKLQEKVCVWNVHKHQSLQNQACFIFKANVKQVICLFSHTGYVERGPLTWKNTENRWMTCIKNSVVGSLILAKLTGHFSWCHVPSHKTLKRHHRSCSWNWLISTVLKEKFISLKLNEFYASQPHFQTSRRWHRGCWCCLALLMCVNRLLVWWTPTKHPTDHS